MPAAPSCKVGHPSLPPPLTGRHVLWDLVTLVVNKVTLSQSFFLNLTQAQPSHVCLSKDLPTLPNHNETETETERVYLTATHRLFTHSSVFVKNKPNLIQNIFDHSWKYAHHTPLAYGGGNMRRRRRRKWRRRRKAKVTLSTCSL